jgi:hypothetical protein
MKDDERRFLFKVPQEMFDRTERSEEYLSTIAFFSMRLAVPRRLDPQKGL